MREPELEEEDLVARVEQGRLQVTRRSLDAGAPPELSVTAPDGSVTRHPLSGGQTGRATLDIPAGEAGLWQVGDGRRVAFAAAMPANPPEVADLRADPAALQALVAGSGGGVRWLGDQATALTLPDLRHVAAGRETAGAGWIGLRRREDHTVTGIAAVPLLPPWLALPLLLGVAVGAWRRESR